MGIKKFFKDAFNDMKEGAKKQHEVDRANIKAVKAESKANFEENRGKNSIKKAKAGAKKVWDDAHMSPEERKAKMNEEREIQIAKAKKREEDAVARYEKAKND